MLIELGLPLHPIDFHCHGVGAFDFTQIDGIDLDDVEENLRCRGIRSVLTLYMPISQFDSLIRLVYTFHQGKLDGRYKYIVGIALEGPLLASFGGTPEQGVWIPEKYQWEKLASCGQKGLLYIVLSPDFPFEKSDVDIFWVVEKLLDGGVMPALGHFKKDDPVGCADKIKRILQLVELSGKGPLVTDHMFNDMPINFTHAWRTETKRAHRNAELSDLKIHEWSDDNLEERLGLVPAAIIRGAQQGLVNMCINFDGEHVDLAISKRIVELVGANKFLMMTDQIQSRRLAGFNLVKRHDSNLLYQQKGIVAGGSQSMEQQIQNMRIVGIPDADIRQIAQHNPAQLLGIQLADEICENTETVIV